MFAVCGGADYCLLLGQIAHELSCEPLTAADARRLREGDLASLVSISAGTDAVSFFQAVTAIHVKVPSETSLLSHAQYVKELFDVLVLQQLFWFGTCDMLADGLTKGSIHRSALTSVCAGTMTTTKETKSWPAKKTSKPRVLGKDSNVDPEGLCGFVRCHS